MSFSIVKTKLPYVEVEYFGMKIFIPKETVAIATNADGSIYAFLEEIPFIHEYAEHENMKNENFWGNGLGKAIRITSIEYEGDWKQSLWIKD